MKILNILLALVVLVAGLSGIAYVIKNDMLQQMLSADADNEHDEEAETEDDDKIHIIDGHKALVLDQDLVETYGLVSETLPEITISPEFSAHAEVIDISPLVRLRTDYFNLLAEKSILQNSIKNQKANLDRVRALHEARSLSTRELEQVRADYEQKIAQMNALQVRIDNYEYRIKSDWGEHVGALLMEKERAEDFNRFASHRASLVMLLLPKNISLVDVNQNVYINHVNERDGAVRAGYLDQAKMAGNPLYGEGYIYELESDRLRPGMRLFAWIAEPGDDLTGLFVPEEAVIWYANDPWIYVQHEENIFVRKPLAGAKKISDGWLLTGDLDTQDRVVIRGGQTLLSEEFKWAIPDEDDD